MVYLNAVKDSAHGCWQASQASWKPFSHGQHCRPRASPRVLGTLQADISAHLEGKSGQGKTLVSSARATGRTARPRRSARVRTRLGRETRGCA